jgi:hypothetical protein
MDNQAGAPSTNLTNLNLNEGVFEVEWINNDEQIIFSYAINSNQNQIGIINTDGSGFRILSPQTAPQYNMYPTWSPKSVVHMPGDLSGDSSIDSDDYQALRKSMGKCTDDRYFNPEADYDGYGCVSYSDYRIWYSQYYR